MNKSYALYNEFVSLTHAYSLKLLGFNYPVLAYYIPSLKWGKLCFPDDAGIAINMNGETHNSEECISAPLYQQAFQFLIEKYPLTYSIIKNVNAYMININGIIIKNINGITFNTYNEAQKAALNILIDNIFDKL